MNKILDFIKEQRVSFWLMVASTVLSLVGFIVLLASNGTQGYALDGAVGLIFASVFALILPIAAIALKAKFGDNAIVDAVFFVALICVGICFAGLLINRIPLAADLFTYDTNNTLGMSAFVSGVVAMVIYLVTAIVLAVASFMKQGSKE